jgi:hypothetical protein
MLHFFDVNPEVQLVDDSRLNLTAVEECLAANDPSRGSVRYAQNQVASTFVCERDAIPKKFRGVVLSLGFLELQALMLAWRFEPTIQIFDCGHAEAPPWRSVSLSDGLEVCGGDSGTRRCHSRISQASGKLESSICGTMKIGDSVVGRLASAGGLTGFVSFLVSGHSLYGSGTQQIPYELTR